MNELDKIKKKYIDLLQMHTSWGKGKEIGEDLLKALGVNEINEMKIGKEPETKLLLETNELVSPLKLDLCIELPVVELFIDKANFVIFTTLQIYSCKNSTIEKIEYKNIEGIDEDSLNNFLRYRARKAQLFEMNIIISNGSVKPITIEYGFTFRPVVYFLTRVREW